MVSMFEQMLVIWLYPIFSLQLNRFFFFKNRWFIRKKIYKHSLSNLATSIIPLKNSTRNSKRLWAQGHISIVTTRWTRLISKVLYVFWYRKFTYKFIAPVFSDPSLYCNYKTEVLSLIMLQGNIVYLRTGNGRTGPWLLQQPYKDYS